METWNVGMLLLDLLPRACKASKSNIQDVDDEYDYLNDAALDDHFKGNQEDKEDHKARCRAMGLWRPCPEYPHKEHLTEFYTRVKTKARNRQRSRNDEELSIKANVDAAGAHALMTQGPFAHPIPYVPGISAANQIGCWPPTVPSSMFPAMLPLTSGQAEATAGGGGALPAAGATAAAGAAASAAAAAGGTADAAAAAPAPKAKAKAKAKPKVAKPLSADTVQAVAQKWCGNIMVEVAKARACKNDLQRGSYGSELVQALEALCQEIMTYHQQIQSLLSDGNRDVEAFRAIMLQGDEVKKRLAGESVIAAALLKAAKGKAKKGAGP